MIDFIVENYDLVYGLINFSILILLVILNIPSYKFYYYLFLGDSTTVKLSAKELFNFRPSFFWQDDWSERTANQSKIPMFLIFCVLTIWVQHHFIMSFIETWLKSKI